MTTIEHASTLADPFPCGCRLGLPAPTDLGDPAWRLAAAAVPGARRGAR